MYFENFKEYNTFLYFTQMMMRREDGLVLQQLQQHPELQQFQQIWRSPPRMRLNEVPPGLGHQQKQQVVMTAFGGSGGMRTSQGSPGGGSSSMGSDSRSNSEENIEETETILFHISRSLPHKVR